MSLRHLHWKWLSSKHFQYQKYLIQMQIGLPWVTCLTWCDLAMWSLWLIDTPKPHETGKGSSPKGPWESKINTIHFQHTPARITTSDLHIITLLIVNIFFLPVPTLSPQIDGVCFLSSLSLSFLIYQLRISISIFLPHRIILKNLPTYTKVSGENIYVCVVCAYVCVLQLYCTK